MRGRVILTAIAVASMLIAGASGAAVADSIGASGSCDKGDSGGQGDAYVDPSGQSADATDPGEVQSVIAGLQRAAQTQANCEGSEDDADGNGQDDYIEAHATGSPGTIQVCYDNKAQSNPQNAVVANQEGDNRCPTDAQDAESS